MKGQIKAMKATFILACHSFPCLIAHQALKNKGLILSLQLVPFHLEGHAAVVLAQALQEFNLHNNFFSLRRSREDQV